MNSKFLPAFIDGARYLNAELAPLVHGHEATPEQVLELCRNHRVMGIGLLLLLGDADEFRRQLHLSGRACLHFLANVAEAPFKVSRTEPFFDALAAGDFECARGIAQRPQRDWSRGAEYEEDFLYMDFLMGHFFRALSGASSTALLERYAHALQGTTDVRLDVCQALRARRGAAFDDALEQMMAERDARQARLRSRGSLSEEAWATECQVSIEGVALVALAVRAEMKVRKNQRFVPSLAFDGALPRDVPGK